MVDEPLRPGNMEDANRDLGFGTVVSERSRHRLLNQDGSFNVRRGGLGWFESLNPYHTLLSLRWPAFIGLLALTFVAINLVFAALYLLVGHEAFVMPPAIAAQPPLLVAFNFSVETFATIGYGHIAPIGIVANALVALEALVGILAVALATGIIFARFARPTARVRFSRTAVVAPYRAGKGWMFRIVNERRSELIEVQIQVIFTRHERVKGRLTRVYYPLALERTRVTFFPLSWTVVHPIDDASPLARETPETLHAAAGEFLVLLSATDEGFAAVVHARHSYAAAELEWDRRFGSMFTTDPNDTAAALSVDLGELHRTEPA
jgi:inward rectifier potassium channel